MNYWSYLNIFSVEGNGGANQSRSRFQVSTVLRYGTQGIIPCTSIQNKRYFLVCDLPINLLRLFVFSVFPALAKKEKIFKYVSSTQCCGSEIGGKNIQICVIYPVLRFRDVYPRSRILIFTQSKNSNKREGGKKNLLSNLFL